ncbi:MAG: hypothetical protein EPN86_01880 [Nanoarchaeota archaeon]|nr:MAG: hypothetical protein EPN86_01880 [Nanoarchaeota archaeon]
MGKFIDFEAISGIFLILIIAALFLSFTVKNVSTTGFSVSSACSNGYTYCSEFSKCLRSCDSKPLIQDCGNYGDVDGDGKISYNDVSLIFTKDRRTFTADQAELADVNDMPGRKSSIANVDPSDALTISQYVGGRRDSFPVCGGGELTIKVFNDKNDNGVENYQESFGADGNENFSSSVASIVEVTPDGSRDVTSLIPSKWSYFPKHENPGQVSFIITPAAGWQLTKASIVGTSSIADCNKHGNVQICSFNSDGSTPQINVIEGKKISLGVGVEKTNVFSVSSGEGGGGTSPSGNTCASHGGHCTSWGSCDQTIIGVYDCAFGVCCGAARTCSSNDCGACNPHDCYAQENCALIQQDTTPVSFSCKPVKDVCPSANCGDCSDLNNQDACNKLPGCHYYHTPSGFLGCISGAKGVACNLATIFCKPGEVCVLGCVAPNSLVIGAHCGSGGGNPVNDACASGYCDPNTLKCAAQSGLCSPTTGVGASGKCDVTCGAEKMCNGKQPGTTQYCDGNLCQKCTSNCKEIWEPLAPSTPTPTGNTVCGKTITDPTIFDKCKAAVDRKNGNCNGNWCVAPDVTDEYCCITSVCGSTPYIGHDASVCGGTTPANPSPPIPKSNCITVINNGDPAKKLDITFIPAKYSASQMQNFPNDVNTLISSQTGLFHYKPFSDYKFSVNVYRVDTSTSDQSYTDAALLASSCPTDLIVVILDDPTYGGGGGHGSATSLPVTYVGRDNTLKYPGILIHELGHAIGEFSEEYTVPPQYEPLNQPPSGPNCAKDPNTAPWKDYPGVVTSQGCLLSSYYRPSVNSIMRDSGQIRVDAYDPWDLKIMTEKLAAYDPTINIPVLPPTPPPSTCDNTKLGLDSAGTCRISCGASSACESQLPGYDIPACGAGGKPAIHDECSPTCQAVDRADMLCRKTGVVDCTGDSQCDGVKAGTNNCDADCKYSAPNPQCVNTAPVLISLSSPSPGSIVQGTSVTVKWAAETDWGINCNGNNNQYQVSYGINALNYPPAATLPSSMTQYTLTGLQPASYYKWQVTASNGALAQGTYAWSFTTSSSSPPPSPAAGKTINITPSSVYYESNSAYYEPDNGCINNNPQSFMPAIDLGPQMEDQDAEMTFDLTSYAGTVKSAKVCAFLSGSSGVSTTNYIEKVSSSVCDAPPNLASLPQNIIGSEIITLGAGNFGFRCIPLRPEQVSVGSNLYIRWWGEDLNGQTAPKGLFRGSATTSKPYLQLEIS